MVISKFLKISPQLVVNTSNILAIEKGYDKYRIIMNTNEYSTLFIMGSGYIDAEKNEYTVCKNKHPQEYEKVESFVKELN